MNFLVNYVLLSFTALTIATPIAKVAVLPDRVGSPVTPQESPSISVNLSSDVLLTTLGLTGEASAGQQVSEGVIGSIEVPATLASSVGSSALLEQSGVVDEVAVVDISGETVDTLNAINTEFLASGSEEIQAALHGTSAAVEYAGESAVPLGGGVTFTNANTEVDVVSAGAKRI